jgi:excisionase family DNA binding protein
MSSSTQLPRDEDCGRTVAEFAQRMNLSRAMAYRVINRGEIPVLRFGKRIIIPERVIDALLAGAMPLPSSGVATVPPAPRPTSTTRPRTAMGSSDI